MAIWAKQAIRIVLVLLLALACGQALALGLGQIQVKSKANEPLLAEIPIISNDPAELEQLQARLASPETFARIGLEPPQGAVANLQFAVVRDNSGGLAIRVTSTQPIDQPMLTFLVEVEWGEGKLVREYSALVDPPRDAPSPSAPLIDTPQTAAADTVSRPAEAPAIDASPTEMGPEQAKPAETAPEAVAAQPSEAPPSPAAAVAVAPPPPAPMPSPDEVAAAVPAVQNDMGPVKAGQTLSEIALGLKPAGYTLDQTMLALLRTNPDAFIGNDINKLKRGAVLRVPESGEIAKLGAAEAAVIVRDQIEQWRRVRQARARARAASVAAMANATASGAPPSVATSQNTPAVAGARLEIIPPAADRAAQAGTRSGASAGGEGDMLRQELQTTQETLAARDAEVQELKSRLADLEKLQQQQQQLIALKDSELAAAQQRLAQSNQAAAKPATATQAAATAQADPVQAESGAALWLGAGLVLVLAGVVAWWLARRRRGTAAPKSARPVMESAALAASVPNAAAVEPAASVSFASASSVAAGSGSRGGNGAAGAPLDAAPRWSEPATSAPTWHAGGGAASAANSELHVGHERIELARAYLDLGDHDTARGLLQEIVQVGDPDARAEAVRLLQDLPR